MTAYIRGLASLVGIALAGVLVGAADRPSDGTAVPATPRLTSINTKVNRAGTSLVIEATEPLAYIATRPDPLTLQLDFRNASVDPAVLKGIAATGKGAIGAVSVGPGDVSGTPASRVRIALTQPVAHHVRSSRNSVIVEFEKTATGLGTSPNPESRIPNPEPRPAPDPMTALAQVSQPQVPQVPPVPQVLARATPQPQPPAPAAAAPLPAAQPVQTTGTGQPNERRYSGHPISLDFQGADLRAVLRTFSEISGLNIVIDPTVTGTVDVALRDVPWDQALDIILRANKLGYVIDGTIVRIAPLTVLTAEEKERSDLAKAQADAGQVSTLTRQLSYAKGEEIVTLLKQANILSPKGQAFVDARTNTLIVTDLAERLTASTDLIRQLDRPQPQVEIEARIVQTNKNYARALGVQWGFNGQVSPALGNTTNLAFPNSGQISGVVGPTVAGGANGVPAVVNLPAPAATSGIGLALGSVNGAFNLDVALTALETSGNGRILSTPRVTTQNNIPAEMTQGQQIPIQTVANNTVTVTFKDAALTLKVTPQITAANTVIMAISLENSSPDFSKAVNGIPPINTQRANTSVLVNDGETTVIGGVYLSQEQAATDRTPGLGQIPLIKWLFKRDTINDTNSELLIFITPRILKS
jgi:type IV pilus assembly protein PilQ